MLSALGGFIFFCYYLSMSSFIVSDKYSYILHGSPFPQTSTYSCNASAIAIPKFFHCLIPILPSLISPYDSSNVRVVILYFLPRKTRAEFFFYLLPLKRQDSNLNVERILLSILGIIRLCR